LAGPTSKIARSAGICEFAARFVAKEFRTIRILHVIASIAQRTGGPAKAVVDMAAAVAARGHAVSIYTTDREMSETERAEIGKPACMNGKVSVQACPDALALARKTD
jgi:hypothetical protein